MMVRWKKLKCPSTQRKKQYGVLCDLKMWRTRQLTPPKNDEYQQVLVKQTLGPFPRMCTGPRTNITTPRLNQARRINSSKGPSVDQEDQDELEKQDIGKEITSLAVLVSLARLGLPRKHTSKSSRQALPGLVEASHSTAPPHERRKS